jgi:hypothetical protein
VTITSRSFQGGPMEQRNIEDFIKGMPAAKAALSPAAKGLEDKARRGKAKRVKRPKRMGRWR